MTYKETKTEQNQTLSNVPLGIWAQFKSVCALRGLTMTAGFIEAATKWMKED